MAANPARDSAAQRAHGPYIGPMPLGETDPIFGRDAEIEELREEAEL